MSHRTVWVSRIQLKQHDFVLVNDGTFGIDIDMPVAARMYLGFHEHCSSENHPIHILRHRTDVHPYLTFACGNPRCDLYMKVRFQDTRALEVFSFADLHQYCQKRIERKRRRKHVMKLLCSLNPDVLEALCRKDPPVLKMA